jgi:plasmid stabilization system protein ParE
VLIIATQAQSDIGAAYDATQLFSQREARHCSERLSSTICGRQDVSSHLLGLRAAKKRCAP